MADERTTRTTDNAYCIACGYPLRALSSNRCPECGRTFDPANPRTMIFGRPLRPWQQLLLRPVSWPAITLALLATLGLVYLSGWPGLSPVPWKVLVAEFRWPKFETRPTAPDVIFYAAVVLWSIFLLLAGPRYICRLLLVPRISRRANLPEVNMQRRRAMAAAAILSAACLVFGWQGRIGRRWVARFLAVPSPQSAPGFLGLDSTPDPPVPLSRTEAGEVLGAAVGHLSTPRDRMAVLGLLADQAGRDGATALRRAASRERDVAVLVWELRMIGLCRDAASEPFLAEHLVDARPAVRAASADAIGILRQPSYAVVVPGGSATVDSVSFDSNPPIDVGGVVSSPQPNGWWPRYAEHNLAHEPTISIPISVRDTLAKMMTSGASAEEREAAARTLVVWPPDHYRLRLAEWGVWIQNENHMALAQSILDEIPPFVHRTGNPISDFQDYFLYPMMVTKPIVHLTVDVPLAADVEVHIREGRPWFGYPKPDDFGVGVKPDEQQSQLLGREAQGFSRAIPNATTEPDDFDAPAISPLADRREGYPWLVPHHRLYPTGFLGDARIFRLGLRWQSLVISPTLLLGDVPPMVPADPRFRWWERLRAVRSSWVTNRGETERFLYYDGPTRATVPVAVTLEETGHRLRFLIIPVDSPYEGNPDSPMRDISPEFHPLLTSHHNGLPNHEGLFVEVRGGVLGAQAMTIANDSPVVLDANLPLRGEAVIATFREMLTRYGLTAPEAEGLVAAWTPQFFQTKGRRFILRMSPQDYARQCPMQVRPAPTEVVRLGLVLTEFDAQPEAGNN